ncbi:MAG TPA: IS1634 family transposase [Mobilitalea sp.]|nr:IS1634 family transposase [Mobilitalea sp.]
MRLKVSRSKNSASLYVTKTVYIDKKERTITVEKLGTETELREKLNGADPYEWANNYIKQLNEKEKEEVRKILVPFKQSEVISKNESHFFNGGYLFLQQLYHQLKLDQICKDISSKYKFTFNLDSILSRLIYGRILFPSSKLNTFQLSNTLLEQPDFELQHIYRALEVISKESDFIQAELYKNSLKVSKRNDKILYYDCTNYFFEIEQEDGIKQYGPSKEHRPNPIVEMGLFMDGDGIPLAFSIHEGNTNEQMTLQPLEKKIIDDFSLAKFVVCTDAGLSSTDNRKFNNLGERAFITTQSIRKLKKHLKEWALAKGGWSLEGATGTFDISGIEESEEVMEKYRNCTFYKERWIKEDGLEQKLIVTFSLKYKEYQRHIRNRQIERATKLLGANPSILKKHHQNDYKRFIAKTNVTSDGEIAENEVYSINQDVITNEEAYDGFYAVCTNLEDDAPVITKINHKRWEIEECFRLLKTDFKARPVYLSRGDRIKAHFTTCFLSLTVYRYLEKRLKEKFTSSEIISQLRDMNFYSIPGEGYIPTYTRTDFTDALHDAFNFRTDYQIVTTKQMKIIFKDTKK